MDTGAPSKIVVPASAVPAAAAPSARRTVAVCVLSIADRKRTLYRLWLVRPDSRRLPESWAVYYGTIEPGTVRGGMKGHHYDYARRSFDVRQAAAMGMKAA